MSINPRELLNEDVLIKHATERFDIEEVQGNEEIYRLLLEIQDISDNSEEIKSPEAKIENDFDDLTFNDLEENLKATFSAEFLQKCLISRITIRPDIIHLAIGKGLYLTRDEYKTWQQENAKIDKFKVRAENFTTFQTSGWLRDHFEIEQPIPLPIVIYGFNESEHENIAHLDSINLNLRERLYKFGTVTHEIGHHAFQFVLTSEQKNAFILLIAESEPLTEYAESYIGKDVYSEEQFCEAVRLITTDPEHLKKSVPELFRWFENSLPGIHPPRRNSQ